MGDGVLNKVHSKSITVSAVIVICNNSSISSRSKFTVVLTVLVKVILVEIGAVSVKTCNKKV